MGNLFNQPSTKSRSTTVTNLEFADAYFITLSQESTGIALEAFNMIGSAFGLSVSFPKTKCMITGTASLDELRAPLSIRGQFIECVGLFPLSGLLCFS